MHLLLPGRHHLLTNHQLALLTLLTQGRSAHGPVVSLLWAITSANHSGTRRNPLPANRREVAIEEFSAQLEPTSFVYHVDDIGHSERIADYVWWHPLEYDYDRLVVDLFRHPVGTEGTGRDYILTG